MNDSVFTIKTPVFEGPLELLLHLVQKRKLFINDISLAGVADEYIQYLKQGIAFSIQERASFISIASTLLLIKSKSLLPNLELTADEEQDIKKLELRLFLYSIIREAGENTVKPMFLKNRSFARIFRPIREVVFVPEPSLSQTTLHENILDVLRSIPEPPVAKPHITIERVMSLEEMISSLTKRIQKSISLSFSQFSDTSHKETDQGKKVHIIVSFLALLELVRQGIVDADQSEQHGDIAIQKSEITSNTN